MTQSKNLARWTRRLGVLGFFFFLAKGMLWLTIPAVLGWMAL